jgi:hypothetical protein
MWLISQDIKDPLPVLLSQKMVGLLYSGKMLIYKIMLSSRSWSCEDVFFLFFRPKKLLVHTSMQSV